MNRDRHYDKDASRQERPRPSGDLLPVRGIPALSSGRGAHAHLLGDGSTVVIADGEQLTYYDLRRTGAGVEARAAAQHRFKGRVLDVAPYRSDRVVVAWAHEERTYIQMVDRQSSRDLTSMAGQAVDIEVAGGMVVAAMRASAERPPSLVSVNATTGTVISARPLASADVTLTAAPGGKSVLVADRRSQTVRRVGFERDCEPGQRPPSTRPPSSRPPTHEPPPPQHDHTGSCCCAKCKERPPGRPRPPKDRPEDDCRPGTSWVPGECDDWIAYGGVIVRNPSCSDDPPCKQRFDFAVARVSRAGRLIAAADAAGRNLALMDARTLRVYHTRSFGRDGALVASSPNAQMLLAYRRDRRQWMALDIGAVMDELPALDKLGAKPAESITFYGHNPENLPALPSPQLGLKRVIVLPVTEPGQAFGDPNVNNLGNFMHPNAFDIVNAYYDEASFGLFDLQLELFGYDAGPSGPPLQMPAPFRSYFHPPFEPGGLQSVVITGMSPYNVTLDGTEQLTLHVVPRIRSEDDLTVPFCALGFSESYGMFPVTLDFDGTQSAELEVEDSEGNIWNLMLAFPSETINIEAGDIEGGLDALRAYLESVIETAESNAGVPGGSPLFAAPEIRRVKRDGFEFGDLDINLRLNDGPGAAKGRANVVSSMNLAMLGFNDPVTGQFSLGADTGKLDAYLERALRQAEADAGYDFTNTLLGGTSVAFAMNTLTIDINLSSQDGGEGASMSVVSAAALTSLGFDSAASVAGVSNDDDENALRDSQQFMDDVYTAAIDRLGGGSEASFFDDYFTVLIGFVGAPPTNEWDAAQPDISGLRMFARNLAAKYQADDSVQLDRVFIGTILDDDPNNPTTAHELGHVLGLPDLYPQARHRDDLEYMGAWELMHDEGDFPHFCAYNKYVFGWIDPDRMTPVPLPDPNGPISTEALLVPVEYWDDDMETAVQAEFGNGLPVAQALAINLGGDQGQFDLVEARQSGLQFSQGLPNEPALLVYNAIDINDDTRYVLDNEYRARIHRLNSGSDLMNAGDEFNLAAAPELAAVGVRVTVVDVRDVMRPYGIVRVFHTRVDREQADYVDLAFTEASPNWQCPDIWVDWAGDNASDDPDDHHVYAEGTPSDQGETVHYPASGTELHWVVARVHNRGTADALNVKINAYKWDPPGAGDTGKKALFRSATIDVVPAGSFVTVPLKWDISPVESAHQCLRCDIADWELPEDPVDAIALASDDVWLSNNWGQKNVFEFVALGGSPYEPIKFDYSVTNDGLDPERAYLKPEGLPVGMKLTVTPRRRVIAPKETAIFRCVLELDHNVIDAGCRNDREFLLVTWRETPEAFARWGACKYKVRPRKKTQVDISGWWAVTTVHVSGKVTPDPGPGRVLLRIGFKGLKPRWEPVTLQPGGTYNLDFKSEADTHLEIVAYYEGNGEYAPAYSPILHLDPLEPPG